MRVAILTAGCRLNQAESDALAGRLAAAGHEVVAEPESADACYINTCAVTASAERSSVQLVRRVCRQNPKPRVTAIGCLVQRCPEKLEQIPGVDEIWDNERKLGELAGPLPMRSRPLLKVQDGCAGRCAYCVVAGLRGGPRSVPAGEVLEQARRLAGEGFAEFVLTGLNIGNYQRDGLDLAGLVARLAGSGPFRLRLGSVEPDTVGDRLVDELAAGHIVPHLHLALQTGDDRLLAAMGRRYDSAGFRALVGRVRQARPDINIGLDVIAGLPGEDAGAFERTRRLLREVEPGYLHVFPYSARPGTRAAAMPGQVAHDEKKRRAEALRRLGEGLRQAYARRFVGSTRPAVVETRQSALTDNYLKLRLAPQCGLAPRGLVDMVIGEAGGRLTGAAGPKD